MQGLGVVRVHVFEWKFIMNCNCHHEAAQGDLAAHMRQQVVVPCSPEMLARLQAEYLPHTPAPEVPEPCEIDSAFELVQQCRIKLKPGAESLLDDRLTPRAYFERLLQNGHLAEARRILAHTLPKRRALWWACLCAQDAYQDDLPQSVARAIEVVTRYVRDPSEPNRREAERVGRSLPPNRLEGCLAMAVFFSQGSVSLPHLPMVPPRPFVTGRLVGVCVYLASVTRSAAHYKDHLRQYLAVGVDIARGQNLWQDPGNEPKRIDPASPASVPNEMHTLRRSARRAPIEQDTVSDAER